MTDTIPDHVGREAVRLLNAEQPYEVFAWPDTDHYAIKAIAKLLMSPPAPMTDPDEEAAKRVIAEWCRHGPDSNSITRATEQMRKEREAWEAGR